VSDAGCGSGTLRRRRKIPLLFGEQKLGNSTERQLEAARNYCERNGLDLDETLSIADEGLSGYKGHHVERGSLGHFLNEVKAGKIPAGTALIIENLDRLSRQGIRTTTGLLNDLTDSGIEVHILSGNHVLKANFNNDPMDIMRVVFQADLAHKESQKKSERIGAAWKSKKTKAAQGVLMTRNVPAWLQIENGKIVEVSEGSGAGRTQKVSVDVVREVFRLATLGVGIDTITRQLGDKVPSRVWVSRALCNRAVLGEFQPKGAEVIQNYFPQIISQSEFDSARAVMQGKRRNGKYVGGNRRNAHKADNPFSGLIFENLSEEGDEQPTFRPLHFQRCARGSYLMSAFDKNRTQNRMRYDVLEKAILRHFTQEDWQAVVGEGECPGVKQAQAELETVLRELDVTAQRIARGQAAMDDPALDVATLKVLASRVAKDEGAIMTLAAQKDALAARVDSERAKCSALHKPEELLKLINSPDAGDLRLRLRSEIAKRVGRVLVTFAGCSGKVVAALFYINGIQRTTILDMRASARTQEKLVA